jgi:hypothetical protein
VLLRVAAAALSFVLPASAGIFKTQGIEVVYVLNPNGEADDGLRSTRTITNGGSFATVAVSGTG